MPPPAPDRPRFLAAGDQALIVEFGDGIDPALNARVHAFDRMVNESGLPGLIETVPTYRSLLVQYNPAVIDHDSLARQLADLCASSERAHARNTRRWRIPCCYGGEFGPDLEDVARAADLAPSEVIARHAAGDYAVFMLGFSPGFPYLGGLDPRLHLPRRLSPRLKTPAQSVMIGGQQACILPGEMPSGWHVLGRTPVRPFDLARAQPFLFAPGDRLAFQPIGQAEFLALAARTDWQPECEMLP